MITHLTFQHGDKDPLTVEVAQDDPNSGLLVVDVKGLGHATSPIVPGGRPKPEPRQLAITFIIRDLDAEGTEFGRSKLRQNCPTGEDVLVGIHKGEDSYFIEGRVESCELNIFSQNENADLVLVCEDPFFRGADQKAIVLDPMMGTTIEYEGDRDTGVLIEIAFSNRLGDYMTISMNNQLIHIELDRIEDMIGRNIGNFDMIYIDTRSGKKSAIFVNLIDKEEYRVFGALKNDPYPVGWPYLKSGFNTADMFLDGSAANVAVTMKWWDLYQGV
jgi:hypothetical protein